MVVGTISAISALRPIINQSSEARPVWAGPVEFVLIGVGVIAALAVTELAGLDSFGWAGGVASVLGAFAGGGLAGRLVPSERLG